MHFGCSCTRQHYGEHNNVMEASKCKLLKMGFKMQMFEIDKAIVAV